MTVLKINFYAVSRGKSQKSFNDLIEEQIIRCRNEMRLGTAFNYQRTLSSFEEFSDGKKVCLSEIDGPMMVKYQDWLSSKGVSPNSVSFYMRNLRAVYNRAVRKGLAEHKYPFDDVYTGIAKTGKRAVSEDVIKRLLDLNLSCSKPLSFARDLFIFSYCSRGMSFVDLAYLRKEDIRAGMMSYVRRKTGKKMSVHIEACMQNIIERYRKRAARGPYVFPILASVDPVKAHNQYRVALNYYNRKLGILAGMLGEDLKISSYTARHTWATAAQRHNIPLAVISAGMGHSSEKVTQIYLAGLDNSVVDSANRVVIGNLNLSVDQEG